LDAEANQTTVRKLIDKMAQDGYLEGVNNQRLGKCVVVHSESTSKKLLEVKKALGDNPFVSVAVRVGWQFQVAFINVVYYYIIGLPIATLLGYKFNFGVQGSGQEC
ncbi:hypothetical protein IFM89_008956, partial [Coptis chinensis]